MRKQGADKGYGGRGGSTFDVLSTSNLEPLELSADELAVLHVLQAHEGRAHAIGLQDLAEATDLHWRTVQDVIAHLIAWHQQPIGSATGRPHGYFLITTTEEDAAAKRQIRSRLIALAKRLAHMERNTPAAILAQLQLELRDEEQAHV